MAFPVIVIGNIFKKPGVSANTYGMDVYQAVTIKFPDGFSYLFRRITWGTVTEQIDRVNIVAMKIMIIFLYMKTSLLKLIEHFSLRLYSFVFN